MIRFIDFSDISPIWKNELWPNRESAIETHSAMMWPPGSPYSTEVFKYQPYFIGIYENDDNSKLIAVNSFHQTSSNAVRSRGLWVDPAYRKKGLGTKLLIRAVECSKLLGCNTVWSFPKLSSLPVYEKAGFIKTGEEDTSGEFGPNYYVSQTI